MRVSQLKIYRGPDSQPERAPVETSKRERTITASVGAILPLLADAIQSERTWLRDFEDDEMTISADLYEVLMAYQYFRRPVA
jgi:hypothetical protein